MHLCLVGQWEGGLAEYCHSVRLHLLRFLPCFLWTPTLHVHLCYHLYLLHHQLEDQRVLNVGILYSSVVLGGGGDIEAHVHFSAQDSLWILCTDCCKLEFFSSILLHLLLRAFIFSSICNSFNIRSLMICCFSFSVFFKDTISLSFVSIDCESSEIVCLVFSLCKTNSASILASCNLI